MDREQQRERERLDQLTRERPAAWLPAGSDTLTLLGAADQLRRFMRDLSPQQRAVLDLVELRGHTAVEAAEMLEISPATVRVHLHRAKAALSQAAVAGGTRFVMNKPRIDVDHEALDRLLEALGEGVGNRVPDLAPARAVTLEVSVSRSWPKTTRRRDLLATGLQAAARVF